ncbi:MAG: Ig-like domain-containing protein [Butyrivibrio sp.]|nr:Ig-like domain-containing protein [Butyrivibrio sp.]
MKLSKNVLAGLVIATTLFSAIPFVPGETATAAVKYSGTYTKEISIEKVIPKETKKDTTDPTAVNPIDPTAANSADTASTAEEEQVQSEDVTAMPGMTFVIAAKRYGSNIKTNKNKNYFKYSTSNKRIAKVTTKGVVTTKKKGKCDITVTNKADGVKFVLHLNVAKKVKVSKVKLNVKKKTYDELGDKFKLTATISPKKNANVPVKWYSSNNRVAKVDNRGNVTVKGWGDCRIYCEAGSNFKSANCRIIATDPDAPDDIDPGEGGNNTGKVVDISQFNTVNDWKQLRDSCDAVIIRVGGRYYGGGGLFEDTKFRSNVYNCQQYGIPYSFYFYSNATTAAEGREEANFIAARVGGYSRVLPVFMDTELAPGGRGRADGLSKDQRTAAIKGACQQLQSSGIDAGVYGSTNWLNAKLNMGDLPYAVWVAQYAPTCTYSGSKLLWQFTSRGEGYGINAGCDVSYWYK